MTQISRVRRPKSAARMAYDRLSNVYDLLAGSSEMPFRQKGIEMLGIRSGEKVLEIGSGTGKALIQLGQQAGEKGLVCGLDLSPGMLHVAGKYMNKARLADRVQLLGGDGAILPFAKGKFSALFMSFSLELFDTPEIPGVLAECWRVLKPGGRLVAVCMSKPARASWTVRLYEWFHERIPNYVDCRPINANMMILAAGFTLVQQHIGSMWGLPVEIVLARKA